MASFSLSIFFQIKGSHFTREIPRMKEHVCTHYCSISFCSFHAGPQFFLQNTLSVTLRTLSKSVIKKHQQKNSYIYVPWSINKCINLSLRNSFNNISSASYLARLVEHSSRCPEMLGYLHPLIYSEFSLTWPWVTWFNLRVALLWAQGWTRDPQRSFLTHGTICFYFHLKEEL